MKKEEEKSELKQELKQHMLDFLNKNEYGIFSDGYVSTYYVIRKPKKSSEEEQRKKLDIDNYYIESYLDGSTKDINDDKTFFEFAKYLFSKGEHHFLTQQLTKKLSHAEDKFKPYITSTIDLLGKNRSLLVKFFSKPSLWEKETQFILPKVLQKLDGQLDKMKIFETIFKSKSFSGIDKQAYIYPIFKANIKTYKEFEHLFNKIEINPNKSSIFNFKEMNTLTFDVDFRLVVSKNLGTELSLDDYAHKFKHIIDQMIENDIIPELKIRNLTVNKNVKNPGVISHLITTEFDNLKIIKDIISDVLLKVENLKTQNEKYGLTPENFIKDSYVRIKKENLEELLIEQKDIDFNFKKRKI